MGMTGLSSVDAHQTADNGTDSSQQCTDQTPQNGNDRPQQTQSSDAAEWDRKTPANSAD